MAEYDRLFRLNEKSIMLTGGCGLIGSAIAVALAEFGATVYVADINDNKASGMCDSSIKFVPMDITDEADVKSAVREIHTCSGRIDVLINCAYPRTTDWGLKFDQIPLDSWNKNLNDHLGGYFITCQKVAEHMKQDGGGSIINIGSIYGVVAPDFPIYEGTDMTMPAAYSAIKSGIIALTRYIATCFGPYRVRANVISPGGIFDHQPENFVAQYIARTPLGRMGTPEDIAGAAVYLASDASSYITGQNIIIDGGWTAK